MHLRAKQDASAGKIWNMQASEKGSVKWVDVGPNSFICLSKQLAEAVENVGMCGLSSSSSRIST